MWPVSLWWMPYSCLSRIPEISTSPRHFGVEMVYKIELAALFRQQALFLFRYVLMEPVDVGNTVLLHRQISLIHQTIQNSSGAAVRHLENASGFFHCDLRVDASMVHPFQQLLLSLGESIGSQRRIN